MQTLIQTVNYYEHLDLKVNVLLDTDIFVQQKFNCDVVFITPPHVVHNSKTTPRGNNYSCSALNTAFTRRSKWFLILEDSDLIACKKVVHCTSYLNNVLQHLHQQFFDSIDFL